MDDRRTLRLLLENKVRKLKGRIRFITTQTKMSGGRSLVRTNRNKHNRPKSSKTVGLHNSGIWTKKFQWKNMHIKIIHAKYPPCTTPLSTHYPTTSTHRRLGFKMWGNNSDYITINAASSTAVPLSTLACLGRSAKTLAPDRCTVYKRFTDDMLYLLHTHIVKIREKVNNR